MGWRAGCAVWSRAVYGFPGSVHLFQIYNYLIGKCDGAFWWPNLPHTVFLWPIVIKKNNQGRDYRKWYSNSHRLTGTKAATVDEGYVLPSSGNRLWTWHPLLGPFSLPLWLAEYFGRGADLRKSLKFSLVSSFAKAEKPWGLLDLSNLRDEASSVYSCSHRAMI